MSAAKKKTKRGWGRGESKGTPVRLFNKSFFRYTRFWYTLWLIHFDSSCHHKEVHYYTLIGNVMLWQWGYTSGYLGSVVKWFEISNMDNVEYHLWRTVEIVLRLDLVKRKLDFQILPFLLAFKQALSFQISSGILNTHMNHLSIWSLFSVQIQPFHFGLVPLHWGCFVWKQAYFFKIQ